MKLIRFVEMRLVTAGKNTVGQSLLQNPFYVSRFFKMLTPFDLLILCLGHYSEVAGEM